MTHEIKKPLQVGSRPLAPGIPNPTCWVSLEAKGVLDKAQDLHRAIRRLRRSTQRCLTCPEKAECSTILRYINSANTAIRELRQEWGLDQE